jgi:hypothetical protein
VLVGLVALFFGGALLALDVESILTPPCIFR